MRNTGYNKLLTLELLNDSVALYFLRRFAKKTFEILKNIKYYRCKKSSKYFKQIYIPSSQH